MIQHNNTNHSEEILKMKEEILQEVKANKGHKALSWNSWGATIVLALLLLFSVMQTVQSARVLNKVKSGGITPASAGSSNNSTLPGNLNDLPDMVGGC